MESNTCTQNTTHQQQKHDKLYGQSSKHRARLSTSLPQNLTVIGEGMQGHTRVIRLHDGTLFPEGGRCPNKIYLIRPPIAEIPRVPQSKKDHLLLAETCATTTLYYAIVLPGRKSAFRAGFWPDCYRGESTDIGPPAGLRPAGRRADVVSFPVAVRPKSGPEARFSARKHYRGCNLDGYKVLKLFKDRKLVILGVWAPPGARETLPKGGGRSPPPFGRVSGAVQTTKIDDFWVLEEVCFS